MGQIIRFGLAVGLSLTATAALGAAALLALWLADGNWPQGSVTGAHGLYAMGGWVAGVVFAVGLLTFGIVDAQEEVS